MRCVLFGLTWAGCVVGQQQCHSISPSVKDEWCNSNCNHSPPNCPASLCVCDGPAPSPSPSPSPAPKPVDFPVFEVDLFMNDPNDGWQATGFPPYLLNDAAKYMNVAGISFIQPADLMNENYDLPSEVGDAVNTLRRQGVAVQLLMGGQISSGWPSLQANPQQAANKAIELMKKYDCGIQVDNEAGGDSAGTIQFIKLCFEGKPPSVYLSMDVAGTPTSDQRAVITGAVDYLEFVNMMVSAPQYDQANSVNFGHQFGIPYEKILVAYYAGTYTNNCNSIGDDTNFQDLAYGNTLAKRFGLKGLSVWAVGGASYANCPTGSEGPKGFEQTMTALGAHTVKGVVQV